MLYIRVISCSLPHVPTPCPSACHAPPNRSSAARQGVASLTQALRPVNDPSLAPAAGSDTLETAAAAWDALEAAVARGGGTPGALRSLCLARVNVGPTGAKVTRRGAAAVGGGADGVTRGWRGRRGAGAGGGAGAGRGAGGAGPRRVPHTGSAPGPGRLGEGGGGCKALGGHDSV
jgi:hypothetical protein